MTATTDPTARPEPVRIETTRGHAHVRLVVSVALLVLAVVLTPLTVVASWAKAQITDTSRYVSTVGPLAKDPDVQEYVANQIAAALSAQLDLAANLESALPEQLRPFAPTLSAGVDAFLQTAALRFTESEAFVELWVAANRLGHRVVAGVLTNRSDVADLADGRLTLDMGEILRQFQQYLVDRGLTIAAAVDLSQVDRTLVIAEGDQLRAIELARRAVGDAEALTWLLFLATVATAIGSVLVAPSRRRAVGRLGIGIALSMLLVAVGLSAARRAFLAAITGSLPAPVAGSLFDTVSASMQAGLRSIFAVGIVIAALVVITNLDDYATRWARPTQAGVVALGVFALIARNDVPASYAGSVLVGCAVTVGILELLRRRGTTAARRAADRQPTVGSGKENHD